MDVMRVGQMPIDSVFGKVHYWVEVDWSSKKYYYDIIDWCIEHLGVQGWYLGGNNKIYFYTQEDRLLFLLKWHES